VSSLTQNTGGVTQVLGNSLANTAIEARELTSMCDYQHSTWPMIVQLHDFRISNAIMHSLIEDPCPHLTVRSSCR